MLSVSDFINDFYFFYLKYPDVYYLIIYFSIGVCLLVAFLSNYLRNNKYIKIVIGFFLHFIFTSF